MKKRIILSLATVVAVAIGVVGMSAFEAHIINVTATIENALTVDTESIDFGTVFPQEALDYEVKLALSQSFQEEKRVDDVEYIIRQKPKCWSETDLAYGLVTEAADDFVCVQSDTADDYTMLPMLCPYLSKHEISADGDGENDSGGINAFHGPILGWDMTDTEATQVAGRLAKSDNDYDDTWNIDLRVPCFEGQCAQDWADFVAANNDTADAADYVLPRELEHKQFGCDLWFEVTGISLPGDQPICGNGIEEAPEQCDEGSQCTDGTDCTADADICIGVGDKTCEPRDSNTCAANCTIPSIGCNDKIEVMLVLDRSGSIDPTEMATLKSAAIAFVNALAPTSDGVHMGQVSFTTAANLDQHLTDDPTLMIAAINDLTSADLTNLEDGIRTASTELENPGDGHDRPDLESPDYMVVITDGNPTASDGPGTDAEDAADAADDARAAGTSIYVVGVGDNVDEDYLANQIANHTGKYFAAADFDALAGILAGIAECNGN